MERKTKEELLLEHLPNGGVQWLTKEKKEAVIKAMQAYADQQTAVAVQEALNKFVEKIKETSYKHTDDIDETCCPYRWAEYRKIVDLDDILSLAAQIIQSLKEEKR